MISVSLNQDSLHQCKSRQIFSHAKLCRFHGCSCTRIYSKTTKSLSQETGPCHEILWTLHQVCAWNREAERRNNSTPIHYNISSRTSGQIMLLLCLKWYFPLGVNSNKPQEQEVHANIMSTFCHAPKSWQNGIFLRCSCISKLGPSRYCVKHRSCGANSVMRAKRL